MLTRRLLLPLLVLLALLLVGTAGYRLIEGPSWSWLDALYMATITLTTVGYGETHPLSEPGRVFTVFYCLGGIFTLYFVALEFIRVLVSGELQAILGKQRMDRSLAGIRDHFIICGYGRMGRYVCKEFEQRKIPFVVIDRMESAGAGFPSEYGMFVNGDATADEVLNRAGVNRAKALVTVASSDADNLYIVLSARVLNPQLFIVARAEETAAEAKLRRVGADRVISPYVLGGSRVAQAVLRPTVVDFLDLATRADFAEMQIEEIRLQPGSDLIGKTLAESRLHEMGLIVVAIKRAGGDLISTPSADCVLEADSTMVVLGSSEKLEHLEHRAATIAKP